MELDIYYIINKLHRIIDYLISNQTKRIWNKDRLYFKRYKISHF